MGAAGTNKLNFKHIFFTGILLLLVSTAYSQKWKYYRHEISGTVGATNFFGELGGSDKIDPGFFSTDLDLFATRYTAGAGYGFKIHERMNLRLNLVYAQLYGSDEFTDNPYRDVRNLSFRSQVYEVSVQYEYYWLKEKTGNVYRLRGIRSSFLSNLASYFYAGIGGIYFNPQAEYNGQWVDLAPLNTEGQGLPDENGDIIPDYEQYTITIPYGVGLKYFFNRQLSLSFEIGGRNTLTDYLDDVSTDYYDNAELEAAYGETAAALADRNNSTGDRASWTDPNNQRGNPESNDYYVYTTFGIHYKFLKGRSIKPRF